MHGVKEKTENEKEELNQQVNALTRYVVKNILILVFNSYVYFFVY